MALSTGFSVEQRVAGPRGRFPLLCGRPCRSRYARRARAVEDGFGVRVATCATLLCANLVELTRTDYDPREHHHLRLSVAAREAARQLRESSRAAHVEIRLEKLPEVEVNAAAVELCVTNYLLNAIKYADPAKPNRYAVVRGSIEPAPFGGREVVVRVRDTGLGVPREKRGSL